HGGGGEARARAADGVRRDDGVRAQDDAVPELHVGPHHGVGADVHVAQSRARVDDRGRMDRHAAPSPSALTRGGSVSVPLWTPVGSGHRRTGGGGTWTACSAPRPLPPSGSRRTSTTSTTSARSTSSPT